MKTYLIFTIIYLSLANLSITAQDLVGDGDLTVGGGDIIFVDDINGPSPRSVLFSNGNGSLSFRTLGTPGGILTLLRDGNLLLENDDNNKTVEFEVTDVNDLMINKGAGGTHMMTITQEGTVGLGISNPATDHKLVIFQNAGESGIFFDNGEAGASHATYSVEVDVAKDYNWRYFGLPQGAYINQDNGFAYTTFSDGTLKKDIEEVGDVLERVLELKPKKYFFKNMESDSGRKTMGFIAQEVEKLFPELVSEKRGKKSLAYRDFSILAIQAIQEQQELINTLTRRIEQLEKR